MTPSDIQHPAGDAVLVAVVSRLHRLLRLEAVVARYGGEEFAVVVRGISHAHTRGSAERLRSTIGTMSVWTNGATVSVTVSIGVSFVREGHYTASADEMIQGADAKLHEAKRSGRNRVAT